MVYLVSHPELQRLKKLSLFDHDIGDNGAAEIAKLSSLTYVDLFQNLITPDLKDKIMEQIKQRMAA